MTTTLAPSRPRDPERHAAIAAGNPDLPTDRLWWMRHGRSLPRARSGPWQVHDLWLPVDESGHLTGSIPRCDHAFIDEDLPGHHTVLSVMRQRTEHTMMSTALTEVGDALPFIARAKGRVLVTGLGLGIVVRGLVDQPDVEHITVIERSPDVLHLVAPVFAGEPKVRIVQADAFRWQPDGRFDHAWHDLWLTISQDNVEPMDRLRHRYAAHVGSQECWLEAFCRLCHAQAHGLPTERLIDPTRTFYAERRKAVRLQVPADLQHHLVRR
jgi:hypothetical protein